MPNQKYIVWGRKWFKIATLRLYLKAWGLEIIKDKGRIRTKRVDTQKAIRIRRTTKVIVRNCWLIKKLSNSWSIEATKKTNKSY